MKIHHVEIQGFGPYPYREVVDFDALGEDGMFVITGRTGAGKTSILDAITFALFGDVPRYGSVSDDRVRSKYLLESDNPTEVSLVFSQSGVTYRVSRRPSYTVPGRKTAFPAWAEIAQIIDGEEVILESRKVREVAHHIAEIVRLNAAQFKQVILLAQGQFQEFLVADSAERRTLLRELFDTGRFLDYSEALDKRSAELRRANETNQAVLEASIASLVTESGQPLPDGVEVARSAELVAWVENINREFQQRLDHAESVAVHTAAELDRCNKNLDEQRGVARGQNRLDAAKIEHEKLASASEQYDKLRERLVRARRADQVWHNWIELQRASAAVQSASDALGSARDDFAAKLPDADPSHVSLVIDELIAQRTKLTDLLHQEQVAQRWEAERVRTEAEFQSVQQRIDKLVAELDESRARLRELETSIPELRTAAAALSDHEHTCEQLAKQLRAAEQAQRTSMLLETSRAARAKADQALRAAQTERSALLQRQLSEYAGVLSGRLVEGEVCPVCGSTEHPEPAKRLLNSVTELDISAAENLVQAAEGEYQTAHSEVTRLDERLANEVEQAQSQSAEDLHSKLRTAETQLSAAQRAQADVVAAEAEMQKQQSRATSRDEQLTAQRLTAASLRAQLNSQIAQIAAQTELLAEARGDFPSIRDRAESVTAQLDAARELQDKTVSHVQAVARQTTASTDLDVALWKANFETTDQLQQARLAEEQQTKLEMQLQDYTSALHAVNQTLADPELQDLPAEFVDLAPARAAAEQAKQADSEAQVRLGQVQRGAQVIHQLASDITARIAESTGQQTEFELVHQLAETVRGRGPNTKRMSLETFALAAELEHIVTAANVLLGRMTSGRYELKYSDELVKGGGQSGLAIDVIDAYNQETRSPHSLSGGEKFQASLALALGLAEVVTTRNGGVRLDTLFIDEGFGALDQDTLSDVLDTIDALREGGRTVGLISHVEKVKERFTQHLEVTVHREGWSTLNVS